MYINPFTPEPPITDRADPSPFYHLSCHQFYCSRTTLSGNVCRVKRSFKPYQNEHNSVEDTGEKGNTPCNIESKIAMKMLFHYPPTFLSPNPKILKAFLKTFPNKMKPTRSPAKEKKIRQKKWKKRGGERAKSKSQDCCVTFKPKSRNFAFCACLNFTSWYFAPVLEGCEVCDLQMAFW